MHDDYQDEIDRSGQHAVIEAHLASLLQQAGSTATIDDIKNMIFDAGLTGFREYVADMLGLFESPGSIVDIDAAIPVIQDAWNYFPHRSLRGQCPADLLEEEPVRRRAHRTR
jgi:hypothetical protein